MKKMFNSILIILCTGLIATMCTGKLLTPDNNDNLKAKEVQIKWDFENADGWAYTHQDTATIKQWYIKNGSLYLRTRAETRDRSKMYTLQNDFINGTYTWKIYIPNIAAYEQASIAGFIYFDDKHEIDFEIGYGKKQIREQYGAGAGELMACMTCQGNPFSSSYVPISPGWHTFSIKLDLKKEKYTASWLIDQVEHKKVPLDFGPAEAGFQIMCSMENLEFIGEQIPSHDNYARFDYVSFNGNTSGSYKDPGAPVNKTFFTSGDFPEKDGIKASVFNTHGMSEFSWRSAKKALEGIITETDSYTALFPYDEAATLHNKIISTNVSQNQVAVLDEKLCRILSVATTKDGEFRFKPVSSRLSFSLGKDLSDVRKIEISGNKGETISGHIKVDIDQLSINCSGEGLSVFITPETGTEFETGKTYYIPMIPGAFNKGFSFILHKNEENILFNSKDAIILKQGETTSLGEVNNTEVWEETRWDFDNNIDGWHYYTHTPNPQTQYYELTEGSVKIWTLANTMDRNKLHTNSKSYGAGIYTWRVYVSKIASGEKASIGAFIYSSDKHELDFEIGYGKNSARASCNAGSEEMVACMTSQANPHKSTYTPISVGWHTLTLRMDIVNGKYKASWYIDGEHKKSLSLKFGQERKFLISCSVENLEFMGDHQPTHDNYALFDYVSYKRLVQ